MLYWNSKLQQGILLSICEAELISVSEFALDLVFFRSFLQELWNWLGKGYPNRFEKAVKRILIRDTYVRGLASEIEVT